MKKVMKIIGLVLVLIMGITMSVNATIYTWDAPTNNNDNTPLTDLAGYRFYIGTNISRVYTFTQDIGHCQYYTSSINRGIVYSAVTAYNSNGLYEGESDFSEELAICLDTPSSPAILNANYSYKTGKMIINWSKPTLNENGTSITVPNFYLLSYGRINEIGNVLTIPFSMTTTNIIIPKNDGIWKITMITSNGWGKVSLNSNVVCFGTSIPKPPTKVRTIE